MPVNIREKVYWLDGSGNHVSDNDIKSEIVNYALKGGKIYVGTDSMLIANVCSFAAVIALHNNEEHIAKYYYKKIKSKSSSYKDLKIKILEEVNLSIQTAQFVLEVCPSADIELHVDIGTKKRNMTSILYGAIKGWVTGMGFTLKVKPDSWASSSIADWHTK